MLISKLGVLLRSKENGEQVAVIEFGPDGMLMCQMIKKGSVFALRSVISLLEEPLYKKYESQKDEAGNLPREILISEAESFAKIINGAKMKIGGIPVTASVEEWNEPDQASK